MNLFHNLVCDGHSTLLVLHIAYAAKVLSTTVCVQHPFCSAAYMDTHKVNQRHGSSNAYVGMLMLV